MNNHEKIILIVIVAFLGCAALYGIVNMALLGPSRELDNKIDEMSKQLTALETEDSARLRYLASLKRFASRTFDTTDQDVSQLAKNRLKELAEQRGLRLGTMDWVPANGSRKTFYNEVGWTVKTSSKLDSVTSFLYLLRNEPYLQKVDNITITAIPRTGEVALMLRYTTLAIVPAKGETLVTAQPSTQPVEQVALTGPERAKYNLIADRDIFRPHVQRPVQPSGVAANTARPPEPPRQSDPGRPTADRFRVEGLPGWGDEQGEVFVTDTANGQKQRLKVGEKIENAEIVAVDYRILPRTDTPAGSPELSSTSRVVLKFGPEFYFVELGDSLGQRRLIRLEELPAEVRAKLPATAPASPQG